MRSPAVDGRIRRESLPHPAQPLWLALHLPQLSLEAFAASLPAGAAAGPLALQSGHRLTAVNEAAARQGLQPGQRRATALAQVPGLRLGQADPARDAQALQAVAHEAQVFTPSVTLDGADTVLLEVSTCLRYFASAERILLALQQAVTALGHQPRVAAAPTATGAALLARWGPGFTQGPHRSSLPALQSLLDEAPVTLLEAAREHAELLQGMGLQRLGALRRLPRAGLARRLGERLLDELDRARGERPDPRRWVVPAETFSARLELPVRADRSEQVLHGAEVLLGRLVSWARARRGRIAAFTLAMDHEPRHRDTQPPSTELHVALSEPSRDGGHLAGLLRERLAHCTLPAPTLALRLHSGAPVPGDPPGDELFASAAREQEGLAKLLDRLRARLGEGGVLQLQPVPDHRPERATRGRPAGPATPSPPAAPPRVPAARQLPGWLLPQPQPLAERGLSPQLDGRELQLLAGPQRLEIGWWDGAPATRDYFIAQAHDGALVWLFRVRLPGDAQGHGWFLHGRFG